MCGIAGFMGPHGDAEILRRMGQALTHRGPDDTGYFCGDQLGLVSKRLSIVDVKAGKQPAYNEACTIVVVFNGEIFNYIQLRQELEAQGHVLSNRSDTAVLPHLYEQYGLGMFDKLSGQFAIAIADLKADKLILARDRLGIVPLHYYHENGEFFFGSEIKALLATGRVPRALSTEAMCEVFTFWAPQHNRTVLRNVYSVLPGEYLELQHDTLKAGAYFKLGFEKCDAPPDLSRSLQETEVLLLDAVGKRLTGDVKIAAYLSGGLDSSLLTAMLASRFDSGVEAFSVGFEDPRFDESLYQRLMCRHLGLKHHTVQFKNSEIPQLLKKIIWHTEAPLLRAGPVPLFKLSELVHQNGVKVVLSGEGADEFFGGYDIFREVKIKNYLQRYPNSPLRQRLFNTINQFSDGRMQTAPPGSLTYFYTHNNAPGPLRSHVTRWGQFGFFQRFLSDGFKADIETMPYPDYARSLALEGDHRMDDWTDLQKSQYLEIETFLSRYLLSSQGDRMAMANSVEVRYPFLDEALVAHCLGLRDTHKIKALNEKYLLKKIAEKYVPRELLLRKKFPYRSPVEATLLLRDPYIKALLTPARIKAAGVFHTDKICGFLDTVLEKPHITERETMLLLGVVTTQVFCDLFEICND